MGLIDFANSVVCVIVVSREISIKAYNFGDWESELKFPVMSLMLLLIISYSSSIDAFVSQKLI